MNLHLTDNSYYEAIADADTTNVYNIYFQNPSFEEDLASHSIVPIGWLLCEENMEQSPPDVHSNNKKFFSVVPDASHGINYAGMVVRADQTKENLIQKFSTSFQKFSTYQFSIDLVRSIHFRSMSRVTLQEENFTTPCILKISLSNSCDDEQVIYHSPLIEHLQWKTYTIEFTPNDNYEYIIFEADYDPIKSEAYNGHLLMDNLSPIVRIE